MTPLIKRTLIYSFIYIGVLAHLPALANNLKPSSKKSIYIASGAMHNSLQSIASRFNVSFSCDPMLVNNKQNTMVSGTYTLPQVLNLILKNSQLSYKIFDHGFVIYQQKLVSDNHAIEEVTVKGIRYSLARSSDLKQSVNTISDAITAQDINDIPNTNLAEALQYIPGVAITREAGEGRQISLRGSYPDFSLVTLNGMPVLANNDSPMDSRVQKQRDRSFDFNILPAELFKQIHISKAYSAEQIAGGISGTIALKTLNPSDNNDFAFIFTPEIGYNDYSGTGAKRYSALISNTWGSWGALASVAYSTKNALEQGANTFRWRNIAITNADLSALNDEQIKHLTQGDYIIPRGNRYSVWESSQQRFGANLSLEYKDNTTHLDLDFLSGFLKGNRNEYHLYPRGDQSTPVIKNITAITHIETNENNELVYANYENARVASESRAQKINTTYNQYVASLKHTFANKVKLNLLLGNEQSSYHIPYSNKIYTQGVSDVSIDYRASPFYADINYSEDLENPSMWEMYHGDLEQYRSNSKYTFAKLGLQFPLNNTITVAFGGDWTKFKNKMYNPQQNDIFFSDINNTPQQLSELPSALVAVKNEHKSLSWLKINTNKALTLYGIDAFNMQNNNDSISSEQEHIQEYSKGVYTLLSSQQQQWQAQLGVRFQSESITSYSQAPLTPISYQLWLPTFNATYFINQQWRLRAGLSKNHTKPLLDSLNLAKPSDETSNVNYVFNPNLKPYTAYNSDISLEGKLNGGSTLNIAFFYKHLNNYIVTTQVPTSAVTNYTPSNTPLLWQSNAENAYQWGSEFSFNYLIAHTYWGVNMQAAYNEGKVTYYNNNTGEAIFNKSLPYLSKITASLMLFYDHSNFNFKVGAIYRDKYLIRAGSLLIDENETGFMPTTYWDASVNYYLGEHWKLKFSAFNLTNEQERQYSNSTQRAYNTTTSGRTFYMGLSYQY
ncbi:TonB-dependent receptor [Pseudoalteromonas sp. MMG010]|uniref:TonB-dependent receptor n=1 Tax=Pseudoalteromonas sp. MMG010 TaxID=2822685 RepID=UPI001B39E078|nr:TonB-dependent receptor [Pseudoalteromonas sp. MMG010]MBQ4833567.1 TonB-dependent receptor [Pseudoalteromonas sp. MMG010]